MSDDIRKMIDKVKNFKQFVNENVNEPKFAFHVTRRKNLNSIKKKGLEPLVPKDYGTDGDVKGVYLFKEGISLNFSIVL